MRAARWVAAGLCAVALLAVSDPAHAGDEHDHGLADDAIPLVAAVNSGSAVTAVGGAPPAPPLTPTAAPPTALVAAPDGGAWLATSEGEVLALDGAAELGDLGDVELNLPVVGMAPTPTGQGYWLVATDGGIFTFGDAEFYGSTGDIVLNRPIVGMAPTPTGKGYWLVASDGGIFTFGDAEFTGSAAADRSVDPVTATAAGISELVLVTQNGSVLDADGSVRATTATGPTVAAVPMGEGYWVLDAAIGPTVSVFQSGGLRSSTLAEATGALDRHQQASSRTVIHRVTLDLVEVSRAGSPVWAPRAGYRVNMSTLAIDPRGGAWSIGPDLAAQLGPRDLLMGHRSAAIRGARPNDTVVLLDAADRPQRFRIADVVDDARVGSAELVLSLEAMRSLGFSRPSSLLAWQLDDTAATAQSVEAALSGPFVRVTHPDSPPSSDPVLATVEVKEAVGEVAYRPQPGSSWVNLDPSWTSRELVRAELPLVGGFTCHRRVAEAAAEVLAGLEADGLGHLIDRADTRRAGGCWAARRIRGPSGGALSRHSYGLAIDLNPSTNAFGATPTMDQRVVERFRAAGFAWGGTWTRPDGMHFEWVGER